MSIEQLLGEVVLPLVTPFDRDGALDFSSLSALVEYELSHKMCDSLFVAGTTGEFYTLSAEERLQLLQGAKGIVGGKTRLVAGTGAATTRDAVALTEGAERLGYDAVAVVLPYYSRPTQEEIYWHFLAVARSTTLPVIIYNIPLFVGVNLAPETLARLAALPNIAAIKDQAGANPVQTSDYLRVAPHVAIYCGDDTMILQVLAQGGTGVVSGGALVFGDLIKEMIHLFKSGAVREATAIHHRLMPFHRALTGPGRVNPVPCIREAVHLATGIAVGPPRPPLQPPTEEEITQLRSVLARLGRLQLKEVRGVW